MRKLASLVSLIVLLALPCFSWGQFGINRNTSVQLQSSGNFTNDVLLEVLTLAAPEFGFAPQDFIRMYYMCNCITVEEISPGVYLVSYGGIGIQIVIDGCRLGSEPGPVPTVTHSRKR
jgi:hypothetical protein